MNFKLIVSFFFLLIFIGCGGGSSDKVVKVLEQNSTNITPKIENYETNSTVKISMYDNFISENNISAISILASDINDDNLTYTLSGVDSDKFIIHNGELLLKKYSTYILPLDYNFDNIYEVSVVVSDGKGGFDIVNFDIEIKEKYEIVTPVVIASIPITTLIPIIEPTPEPIISMNLNEKYTVNKGDKVEILTEDSVINVLHTLDDDTKIITLISGSANLIKGDFKFSPIRN